MAIYIKMKSSESFIDNLKAQIDNGKISDWTYDSDGDFSSRKAELCNQAWFHPYEFTDMCIFGIVGRKNINLPFSVYAQYHGDFLKELLLNFPNQLANIYIKQPSENDFDTKNIDYRL